MLHIILLILKILGLFLLGILGLVLLLAIIILVSPAVYRLEASGEDTPESIRGKLRFHWLLRFISGEMYYEYGALTWHIRAGWKRFGSDMKNSGAGDSAAFEERLPRQKKEEPRSEQHTEQHKEQNAEQHKKQNTEQHTEKPRVSEEEKSSDSRLPGKKKDSLYERLKSFWEKIKYTFQKICDNIRSLVRKKERLTAFIQNEVHKSAFLKVMRELRRFLKTVRPREAEAYAEFGFTDPAVTGYVLALASMVYPLIGEYAEIRPDFEHKVLRGRVYVRGRIRALHAAAFAMRLLADKNVKTTYRHIRKFKL